jgi:hypothetical protein
MRPLDLWMYWLLRFVAVFNILAGLAMLIFYHEAYKLMGIQKPELVLPLQLCGGFVALFGIGYWITAGNPVENRNVLLLGSASKAMGSCLGIYYVALGSLPALFLVVLFFADIIYLVPLAVILRRLYRLAAATPSTNASSRRAVQAPAG